MHATVSEYTEVLRTAWLCAVVRISFVAAGLDDGFGVFLRAHGRFVNSFVCWCAFRVVRCLLFCVVVKWFNSIVKAFRAFRQARCRVVF